MFAVADVDSFNFGVFQRLDGFALSARLGFALGDGDDIELPYPRSGKRKQGEEHDEPRRPFGRGADGGFSKFEVRRQKVALVTVAFGRVEFVAHGPDVAPDGEVAFCQVAPRLFVDVHVCSFMLGLCRTVIPLGRTHVLSRLTRAQVLPRLTRTQVLFRLAESVFTPHADVTVRRCKDFFHRASGIVGRR